MIQSSTPIRRASVPGADPELAARSLREALIGDAPAEAPALVICFVSPQHDLERLAPCLAREFGDVPLIGCTTGAEIGPDGYATATLTGVALPADEFQVELILLPGLSCFDIAAARTATQNMTSRLDQRAGRGNRLGFLLIDGLSTREELVASTLHSALGGVGLFGGSAGDGLDFRSTFVYHQGAFHQDAALLTLIQTELPFEIFKSQHFVATERKLVVTEADPRARVVREIDGEPAAQRYASVVGVTVEELTPLIFSTHPLSVRIAGSDYLRSIQSLGEDGSLNFFCAIDEGLVLSVCEPGDVVAELNSAFEGLRERLGPLQLALGCDCILRNIEIQQKSLQDEVRAIFQRNNLIGFSTYGEQYNGMHVSQTLTGVAIGSRTRP